MQTKRNTLNNGRPCRIQSPMEKVQGHGAYPKYYLIRKIFGGFHFNPAGTLFGGARFISHKFTNEDHSNEYYKIALCYFCTS